MGIKLFGRVFFDLVELHGERMFLKVERAGTFDEISWKEFGQSVHQTIFGLLSLGLKKGDRLTIVSENRVEWMHIDMACLSAGIVDVPIAPGSSDMAMLKILNSAKPTVVIVENAALAERLSRLSQQAPSLKSIVMIEPSSTMIENCVTLESLRKKGAKHSQSDLQNVLGGVSPSDPATILYTSGSTGDPKGALKTQGNVINTLTLCGKPWPDVPPAAVGEVVMNVLTFNHFGGRFHFLGHAANGFSLGLPSKTGNRFDITSFKILKPWTFSIVPRLMDKILSILFLDDTAKEAWASCQRQNELTKNGTGELPSNEIKAAQAILSKGLQDILGGGVRHFYYVGARMPDWIVELFQAAKIPMGTTYGSTECGQMTRDGRPHPGVQIQIASDGEILIKGPQVLNEYYENPEMTRESIDTDGWFHTGDQGKLDENGRLHLIGRLKEAFYCADGSYVYPSPIEQRLESFPIIREAIVFGSYKPFMVAVVVPNYESIGKELGKASSALTSTEVTEAVWLRVNQVNEQLEIVERIKKIVLSDEPFGNLIRGVTELGKTRTDRKEFEKRFETALREFYSTK